MEDKELSTSNNKKFESDYYNIVEKDDNNFNSLPSPKVKKVGDFFDKFTLYKETSSFTSSNTSGILL